MTFIRKINSSLFFFCFFFHHKAEDTNCFGYSFNLGAAQISGSAVLSMKKFFNPVAWSYTNLSIQSKRKPTA